MSSSVVNSVNKIKFSTINCNSILNKVSYVFNFLTENKVDILSLSETWLISNICSSFVEVPGYVFYCTDVLGEVRKHGVGLYVRGSMGSVQIDVDMPNVVVVHLPIYDLYIVSLYRPPSYSVESNNTLMEFLADFSLGKDLVLLGDFNLPSLRWDRTCVCEGYVPPMQMEFYNCFLTLGLSQWVEESTFDLSDSILDLVFTSRDDAFGEVEVLSPLQGSYRFFEPENLDFS